MLLRRVPKPALRPFVSELWHLDQSHAGAAFEPYREHVLPTGHMHLVFRLADQPLRIFDHPADHSGRALGTAIVGAARASFYVREVAQAPASVGVQFRPGAAELLFGVPADELAGHHFELRDFWGYRAALLNEQLAEIQAPALRMDLLESVLAARLPHVRGMHPAIARALEQMDTAGSVDGLVKQSGYSHRTFIAEFRRTVGLTPKLYARVLRFENALRQIVDRSATSWVDLALCSGYSDQSHFNREFRDFSGVTPMAYLRLAPPHSHHIAIVAKPPVLQAG